MASGSYSSCSVGSSPFGGSPCGGAQAQESWHTCLVPPWHAGSSGPGIEPMSPTLQSRLDHWTAREPWCGHSLRLHWPTGLIFPDPVVSQLQKMPSVRSYPHSPIVVLRIGPNSLYEFHKLLLMVRFPHWDETLWLLLALLSVVSNLLHYEQCHMKGVMCWVLLGQEDTGWGKAFAWPTFCFASWWKWKRRLKKLP